MSIGMSVSLFEMRVVCDYDSMHGLWILHFIKPPHYQPIYKINRLMTSLIVISANDKNEITWDKYRPTRVRKHTNKYCLHILREISNVLLQETIWGLN